MDKTINVLSVSGGKDSTAMWLFARELGVEVVPVFADTGHEHEQTYEYLDYLENKLGPIKRVKPDFTEQIARKRITVVTKWRDEGIPEEIIQRALETLHPTGIPFLDLCLWKGRFPSTKARFCTQFLKVEPIEQQVFLPILAEGNNICSWQGVRAQESPARAKLSERESTSEGFEVYRPLLHWTVEDVFAIHKKHGIEPNPLYKLGMGRVGCMPCLNCNKQELFEIARRFPKEIERVAEWERIVAKASKRGLPTFFPTANGNGDNIHEVVEWSKTAYGGKQYDLVKAIEFENVPACSSAYGLCE
ncbi:phosphoadenosine phosphosulfate reductase (plasmid) [Brevibacillus laterosporus]|nr:phosphoadenosine phosphosulfate reductase family protein [Brevibacillus laterosporus]TPG93534.1 phosphoadenosine phosphosulfate reductase [Brevibacillus laterosporus]